MSTYTITGKTINGNHINAPRRSCKPIDCPTEQRITVTIDGTEYDRAIYERIVWRNSGEREVISRFVIVNGTNYEVAEVPEAPEAITKDTVWNTTTQSTYELAIDHDLLGNAGFDTVKPWHAIGDNTQLFALDADDIEWWESHPDGIVC